jgi:hypothetical protein
MQSNSALSNSAQSNSIPSNSKQSKTEQGNEHHLTELLSRVGESFDSEASMRSWLKEKGVDCTQADGAKGLQSLYGKIEKGEATLVYSQSDQRVYRGATTARISTEVTIHGERYPLFELCQIFLENKIEPESLAISDPEQVPDMLASISIRNAHVRSSQELWETFIGNEDPLLATRRGIKEELGLSDEEAERVDVRMLGSGIEYEEPIDWPGIHSVLRIHDAHALLPEEISKPVFVELEKGEQLSIFVATPNSQVLRGIMKMVIPRITIKRKPIARVEGT